MFNVDASTDGIKRIRGNAVSVSFSTDRLQFTTGCVRKVPRPIAKARVSWKEKERTNGCDLINTQCGDCSIEKYAWVAELGPYTRWSTSSHDRIATSFDSLGFLSRCLIDRVRWPLIIRRSASDDPRSVASPSLFSLHSRFRRSLCLLQPPTPCHARRNGHVLCRWRCRS